MNSECTNTPIDELKARYIDDGCNFSDLLWVKSAAMRYVESMQDSQVRCLLHALAQSVTPAGDVSRYIPMIFNGRMLLVHPEIEHDVQGPLIAAAMQKVVDREQAAVQTSLAALRG